MAWRTRPPVERVRNGFRINLQPEERELLERLLGELRGLLVGPDDAPALHRLFPAAYHLPEHADHDAEYQRLMREELAASRLAGIEIVLDALAAPPPLSEDQVMALLQALNGIRLVLGTVLDVSEELDLDDVPEDDPQLGEYHLYGYLSWLLEWTVRALSSTR
jgi:Domain of unknown function (DUF2017)